MKSNDLTILLTLKGRHLHTLRWLWHANRIGLPFHVIVADGEVHPTIDRLLSNPATFPHLSFEYHRYEDRSFSDFYYKCADALKKVKTPYVMMCDNDDFVFPYGLMKSINFLNGAPDYVCAGGGIPGFTVIPQDASIASVTGRFDRIFYRYIPNGWYLCRDIDSASAALRVLEISENPLAIFYSVYRTQSLCTIAEEMLAYNFNFRMHEIYYSVRTATLGKIKSTPSYFSNFRQWNTSSNFGSKYDWVEYLLLRNFAEDFKIMATKVAHSVAQSDGCNQAEFEERFGEVSTDALRKELANSVMRYRFPRLFDLKQRFLSLPRPRLIPAWMRRWLDRKGLWRQLALDGASRETIEAHLEELEEIEVTLQGREFAEFISRNAPELLAVV